MGGNLCLNIILGFANNLKSFCSHDHKLVYLLLDLHVPNVIHFLGGLVDHLLLNVLEAFRVVEELVHEESQVRSFIHEFLLWFLRIFIHIISEFIIVQLNPLLMNSFRVHTELHLSKNIFTLGEYSLLLNLFNSLKSKPIVLVWSVTAYE